jgi:hypothetical protein
VHDSKDFPRKKIKGSWKYIIIKNNGRKGSKEGGIF